MRPHWSILEEMILFSIKKDIKPGTIFISYSNKQVLFTCIHVLGKIEKQT